jgi:hypothetical protein
MEITVMIFQNMLQLVAILSKPRYVQIMLLARESVDDVSELPVRRIVDEMRHLWNMTRFTYRHWLPCDNRALKYHIVRWCDMTFTVLGHYCEFVTESHALKHVEDREASKLVRSKIKLLFIIYGNKVHIISVKDYVIICLNVEIEKRIKKM